MDFTGSDWCGWCIRLDEKVFDTDFFKTNAVKDFVHVKLDYPQKKKLPDALKKQNDELRDKYGIRGYPTVLILNPAGDYVLRTGYQPGGPEKYLESLRADLPGAKAGRAGLMPATPNQTPRKNPRLSTPRSPDCPKMIFSTTSSRSFARSSLATRMARWA